jgi:hypothetical protein
VDDRYDEVSHSLSTIAIKKVDFNWEAVAEAEWKCGYPELTTWYRH